YAAEALLVGLCVERCDEHAALVADSRSSQVQKMMAIRQKHGTAVAQILTLGVQRGDRDRHAALGANLVQRRTLTAKHDQIVLVPGSRAPGNAGGQIADRLYWPAIDIHFSQRTVVRKGDEPAVGRPEWRAANLHRRQLTGVAALEEMDPQCTAIVF